MVPDASASVGPGAGASGSTSNCAPVPGDTPLKTWRDTSHPAPGIPAGRESPSA